MGKSASALLLILVAILAISAAPANKAVPSPVFTHPSPMSPRRTLRVPLTLSKRNTTFSQFDRRSTELISLRSFQETAWIGKLAIGTPNDGSAPKVYEMVFDTGSHLTWVADSTCSNCGNLPMYDGSQSSTFKDLGGDFTVHYGDNTDVLGTWTNDLYQLGDIQFRHNFGRANQIPDFNVREGSSGIVGLRLGKRPPYPTIIRRIGALNLLDDDVISCRFVKDNAEQAGDILFGGIDPQYIQGGLDGLTYAKATGSDWRIRIDDVQVEGRSVGKGLITLVDTGASFIRLNANIVAAIYQNSGAKFVDQRTGWIVPDPFPFDVTFVIGQAQFTVPKEDIPLRNLPPIDNMFSGAFQMNNGLLVLGIPFIKNHYVVFDFNAGSERVGIGKRTS